MKPAWRSAGDPSRLNHVASRRSSLRFGRNTRGIPPSRALSAGPPPGELGLAGLGAHPGSTTGCSPRRFAPLIVAFRSKHTRASSPGGGSSLTRLVSRAPPRSRRSCGLHHRLLTWGLLPADLKPHLGREVVQPEARGGTVRLVHDRGGVDADRDDDRFADLFLGGPEFEGLLHMTVEASLALGD